MKEEVSTKGLFRERTGIDETVEKEFSGFDYLSDLH